MKYDFNNLYEGPRKQLRAKKRKRNAIITICVSVIVLFSFILLINIVGENGPTEEMVASNPPKVDNDLEHGTNKETVDDTTEEKDNSEDIVPADDQNEVKDNDVSEQSTEEPPVTEEAPVNEKEMIIDTVSDKWEPVGTVQEEPHISSYEKDSIDWQERLKAIEVATGLNKDQMIVWWLGNGGGPNKSEATVSSSDQQEKYRVYLTWVEHEGWMPTKVERVNEIPMKKEDENSEKISSEE